MKKRFALAILVVLGWIPIQDAHAQCVAVTPGDYQQIISDAIAFAPATDVSVQMLHALFGPDYLALSLSDGGSLLSKEEFEGAISSGLFERAPVTGEDGDRGTFSVGNTSILGLLSVVMNAACLVLVFWLLIIIIFTGSLNSAHEGVVLGQQYSTLWVPVRTVMAIGALMPIFGGYSLAQQVIMIVGRIAIGFANIAYQIGLSFIFVQGGSVITQQERSMDDMFASMVESELCMIYADDSGFDVEVTKLRATDTTNILKRTLQTVTSITDSTLPEHRKIRRYEYSYNVGGVDVDKSLGACGVFSATVPREKARSDDGIWDKFVEAYDAYWDEFDSIQTYARNVAVSILAGAPVDYDTWMDGQDRLNAAYNSLRSQTDMVALTGTQERQCEIIEEMSQLGWVMLGGIYWNVSSRSAETYRQTAEIASTLKSQRPNNSEYAARMEPPSTGVPFNTEGVVADYLVVLDRLYQARDFVGQSNLMTFQGIRRPSSALADGVRATAGGTTDDSDSIFRPILELFIPITDSFIASLTKEGDVIANLSDAGHKIMWVGIGGLTLSMAAQSFQGAQDATFLTKGVATLAGFIPGVAKVQAVGAGIANVAGTTLVLFWMPMLVLGLYFTIYLPAIPIIYWFGSVTSWLIANLQAVVSAPIWAAAHIVPQGNGFSSDQARNGYMTILSILLRPLLIVIGFFAGMAVLQIVGMFVGALFPIGFRSISMNSLFGPIYFIGIVALFLIIFLSVANRVFSLAFEIADDILEYFGGGRRQLGEANTGSDARAYFAGAFISKGEQAASAFQGKVAQDARDKKEAEREKGAGDKGGAKDNSGA